MIITMIELLPKTKNSRIRGVRTYKVEGPVIIKVSAIDLFLKREKMGLSAIEGFPHHAKIICDFTCKDNKSKRRWIPTQLCIGDEPLHFFVMEYIANGDLEKYIRGLTDLDHLRSIFMQLIYCFIELGQKYKIYHGDIHSGNILIDTTHEEYSKHIVNGEEVLVKTFGRVPKLIDFGRCGVFNAEPKLVFELNTVLWVCLHYIKDTHIKDKLTAITLIPETEFSKVNSFVEAVLDAFT
jgi:serine/threonine protein kinase